MNQIFKLTHHTPSRQVKTLLPRNTQTVHAYIHADNSKHAAELFSDALGVAIRPTSVLPVKADDTIPNLLFRHGMFNVSAGRAAALLYGSTSHSGSLIIKVSGRALQIVGHIEGQGRSSVLHKGAP